MYLESSTAFHWNCPRFSILRSCRIYCDACGDDASGFLDPLVRFAYWDRGSDGHNTKLNWPNVVIQLSRLPLNCLPLQSEIENLQRQADGLRLDRFGLPVRRDFGGNMKCDGGRFRIETQAGWQSITRDLWISNDSSWIGVFDTFKNVVDAFGQSVVLTDWVERYERSPEQLASGQAWDWKFQPQPLDENRA